MEETSQKQVDANRENGKLGGVKTEEGKNISKYNALKHGILSKEVLLEDEDADELAELGKRLRQELKPAGEIEMILVERIVANTWRLKRALRGEAEMIEDGVQDIFAGKKTFGKALSYDFANYDSYGKFVRYETSLERGIYRALHELQRIQANRNGEKLPLPVAVDVDINHEN